jgi:subtilisin-like proprotein convertase family protein
MKNARFLSKRSKRIVALIFASLSLAMWSAMQMPGFNKLLANTKAVAIQEKLSKEEMSARLNELDEMIGRLKAQLADSPKSRSLSDDLQAAIAEYDSLSASMGGDRASATSSRKRRPAAVTGGGGPTPPTGCAPTVTTSTNNTPVAVPTGPAVVSSTLNVAGAGPYLWDVNLTTFLPHTFAADLDITIASPAGTVVTLTTDNGAGNDNVFNGTVWDDDAADTATDHIYANLVLASPLIPEEAMGAFVGEDPNGTWTITISDDLAGDGGSLDSWTLELTTFPLAPSPTTTSFTNSTPLPIVDVATSTSMVTVSGVGTSLCELTLMTNLQHTFAADLDITLMSPAGTVVTLTTDNGAGNDNVFDGTLWDDNANPAGQVPYVTNNGLATDHAYVNNTLASPLVPEGAMAAFQGEDPNGTWTISIVDDLAGDTGTLSTWTLNVTTCICAGCTLTCPSNTTVSNDPNQCGAVVNYPPPTSSGTCGTITCSPPSGSFFPVGTTTVTCMESGGGGGSCSFTITVSDTQPPTITCPANVVAVADPGGMVVVTFDPPVATDNCPGVTTACVPPSGSTLPLGSTTVTCTATDAAGNTATCSFTVTVFDARLQDDSDPSKVVLWNTTTGEYSFCCGGTTFSGVGKSLVSGNTLALEHNATDRRVRANLNNGTNPPRGNASLQFSNILLCTIADRNTTNNTATCGAAPPPPAKTRKK